MIALLLLVAATTTDGSTSGLPKTELAKLGKHEGFRFFLPTYVPKGFKFVGQSFSKEGDEPAMAYWHSAWQHPRTKATLTLQMASDGLGDPILDDDGKTVVKEKGFKSGMFGEVGFIYTKDRFASFWAEVPGQSYPRVVMVLGEKLSVDEGIKVFRSLRWYQGKR